jgi:hypothetical protein
MVTDFIEADGRRAGESGRPSAGIDAWTVAPV